MTTALVNGRRTLQRQAEVCLAPATLSAVDEADLDRLWGKTTRLVRGSDLAAHLPCGAHLIIEGWACQVRESRQGERQILGFLLPGDLVGSADASSAPACRVKALTRLATLPLKSAAPPSRCSAAAAALTEAADRAAMLSQHWIFNHVERLAGRDAYRAIIHLFLELNERLTRVGLACDGVFPLPIGQRILADALGLSLAHTHQMIKRLSLEGLVEAKSGTVRLVDVPLLAHLSDFAPAGPAACVRSLGGQAASDRPRSPPPRSPTPWAQSPSSRGSAALSS